MRVPGIFIGNAVGNSSLPYWTTQLKSLMTFWGTLGTNPVDRSGNGNNATTAKMVTDNDSMVINPLLQSSLNTLGANDVFFDNPIYEDDTDYMPLNEPKPVRPKDVRIIGNRIFGGLKDLIIFNAALTGDDFKTATKILYKLSNFNRFLTSFDRTNYVDFNGNIATVTGDNINLNPTDSSDSVFELFDKRNIVGNGVGRPEIWDAALYDAVNPFVWTVKGGTYNLHMGTVEKYIQPAYRGRLFIKQNHFIDQDDLSNYTDDRSYIEAIICYASVPSSYELSKAYEFINWPSTISIPTIVGDGATDDAIAINDAFANASGVLIYNQTAKIQQPIQIPSNKYLIFADAGVIVNNAINDNTIRNSDLTNGNTNINLIGLGTAFVDANGGNQDRTLYQSEGLYTCDPGWWHYFNIFFCNVTNLYASGLKIRKSTGWSFPLQGCYNVLIENIDYELQDNVQLNQDGIGVHYGTQKAIVRNIMGYTYDDFIPTLNTTSSDEENYILYSAGYAYRKTQDVYYENILPYYNNSGVARIVAFDNSEIENLKYRNIQGRSVDWFIFDFTNYLRTGTGSISNVDIKNVLVSNVSANIRYVIHFQQDVTNIVINDLLMKSGTYNYLIQIESGFSLTDVTINSRYVHLEADPTTAVLNDLGGVLTNFTHTEVIESASTYLARMTTPPSAALALLIRKTVADLLLADIWNSMIQFSKTNIHNETDAKLNWKGNYYNIVTVGSPTFTSKKGWHCVTNKYFKAGLTPATVIAAGNLGEDDSGFLIDLFETAGDYSAIKINGAHSTTAGGGAAQRFQLDTYSNNDKKCYGYLNCNAGGTVIQNDEVASANGVFFVERNNNKMIGYYNGVKCSEIDVIGSIATVNQELAYGGFKSAAGTFNYFPNAYVRTVIVTKHLGATKQLALYNILKYFNDNVGSTF